MARTRNDNARKQQRRIGALLRLERTVKFKNGEPRAVAEAKTLESRVFASRHA